MSHRGHLWTKDFDGQLSCGFCRARPGDTRSCIRVVLTDVAIELWREKAAIARLTYKRCRRLASRMVRALLVVLRILGPRCWLPLAFAWSVLWFTIGLLA
jgi:hypothetical protein